ncbi:neurotrypsin-like isoform X2 [Antedon mediterranea]|uniref:neurotrypsin-like isoform X2 n=1 Tax=Antedon mediterranea TaxID=105859 RepID=UPI003AF93396
MVVCRKIVFLLAVFNCVNSDLPVLDLRLAAGDTNFSGRVEVYYQGRWGTVCDDLWKPENSMVVCRQLGYGDPVSTFTLEGNSSQPIYLDEVDCNGIEATLSSCTYQPIGEHNCRHYEDLAITCSEGRTMPRLRDGVYSNSGRLEMTYPNGEVGRICNDTVWTVENSQVTCRELGYNKVDTLNNTISDGNADYKYKFDCGGFEDHLWDCGPTLVNDNITCNPVKLQCSNEDEDQGYESVRIVGNGNRGRILVDLFGVLGTMCSRHWSQEDSEVVCRQLGFKGAEEGLVEAGDYSPFHKFAFQCTGSEQHLNDCYINTTILPHECSRTDVVAIVCQTDDHGGSGFSGFIIIPIVIGIIFFNACCSKRRASQRGAPAATPSQPQPTTPSAPDLNGTADQPMVADLPPSYTNVINDPNAYKRPDDNLTPPPAYTNLQFDFNEQHTTSNL